MVVIRLARTGAKKKPFYHIVVANKRDKRDGRFIERLGYFDPVAEGESVWLKLDRELLAGWLAKGAQPSERVEQLITAFQKQSEEMIKAKDSSVRQLSITTSEKRRTAKQQVKAVEKTEEAAGSTEE